MYGDFALSKRTIKPVFELVKTSLANHTKDAKVLLFCCKHCEQCHCLSLARDSSIDLKSLVHEQKIPSITTLLYDLCGAQAV